MSTKAERSEAAKILGQEGRRVRWETTSRRKRTEFARELAAARWPSFAKVLEEERTSAVRQRCV